MPLSIVRNELVLDQAGLVIPHPRREWGLATRASKVFGTFRQLRVWACVRIQLARDSVLVHFARGNVRDRA